MIRNRIHTALLALLSSFVPLSSALAADAAPQPLEAKPSLIIQGSSARAGLFEKLPEKEKNLLVHLQLAARAGKTVLFYQNHRHGLQIRDVLVESLKDANLEKTKALFGGANDAFNEYVAYSAIFMEYASPYSSSNLKYALKKANESQLRAVFQAYAPAIEAAKLDEIVKLMLDPVYELRKVANSDGTDLAEVGGNIYDKGITGAEVDAAIKAGLNIELNCHISRDEKNGLKCVRLTTASPGAVGEALTAVVRELRLALPFAMTDLQKEQIEATIKYLEGGNVDDFRKANIAWVKDRDKSPVDHMMGFVEVYDDYKGNVGSWESYVQIVDPETTQLSHKLATNAQYFEDKMPYGQWKKTFPADYSPPALMVYYFQEIADMRSGGYNLPNFDDIRRDIGFKNIIRLPLPGEDTSADSQARVREGVAAYAPAKVAERLIKYNSMAYRVIVLLHEIIGHGSGTYDTTKYGKTEDPVSALGSLGSSLEEQRADLAALTFADDPRLIDVGIYRDAAHAREVRDAIYDFYLKDFLIWLARQHTFDESHLRGNWLLVHQLLEKGAIAWVNADGTPGAPTLEKQVLSVVDYAKFQQVSKDLLAELQRIKANRDEAALQALMKTQAPREAASEPWALAIIERGTHLKSLSEKLEQPWTIQSDSSGFKFQVCGQPNLLDTARCLENY